MAKNYVSKEALIKGLAACAVSAATVCVLGSVAAGPPFTPGAYSASAKGIESDVTVTMTFEESGITDVQIDVSGETPGIGADIGDEMIQKILAAQSGNVDGKSGATITSNAVKAAAADCIAQAQGGAAAAK